MSSTGRWSGFSGVIAMALIAAGCTLPDPCAGLGPAPTVDPAAPAGIDLTAEQSLERLVCEARHGDQSSQYLVGKLYEEGVGVPADPGEAAKWYRRAAKGRSGTTHVYSAPVGDERYGRALPVTTGPATPGLADAQYRLGLLYRDGRGVDQNLKRARRWLERAAEKGHQGAQRALAGLGD